MPVVSGLAGSLQEATNLPRVLELAQAYFSQRGVVMMSYHHHPPIGAQDYMRPVGVEAWGFPSEWVEEYVAGDYERIDPITRRAMRETQPFWWSEIAQLERLRPRERQFLKALHRAHLGDGLAVPVFGPRGRDGYVGLGLGHAARMLPAHRMATFQMAAQLAHQRYCDLLVQGFEDVRLSPREEEVLRWAAAGKSTGVIADILQVSPNTIDTHFRRAFAKLGVNDRVTAVLRALALGLIM